MQRPRFQNWSLRLLLILMTWGLLGPPPATADVLQDAKDTDSIAPKTIQDAFDKVFKLMRNSGALESINDEEWEQMEAKYRPRAEAATIQKTFIAQCIFIIFQVVVVWFRS